MFCKYCGHKLDEDAKFCSFCGKPQDIANDIHENALEQHQDITQEPEKPTYIVEHNDVKFDILPLAFKYRIFDNRKSASIRTYIEIEVRKITGCGTISAHRFISKIINDKKCYDLYEIEKNKSIAKSLQKGNFNRNINGLIINAVDFCMEYHLFEKKNKRNDAYYYISVKTKCGLSSAIKFVDSIINDNEIRDICLSKKENEEIIFNDEEKELDASGEIFCPKCHSTKVYVDKKGYSLKKGIIGTIAIGPIGLIAGKHKSNNLKCTCIKCGYSWEIKN